MNPFTTRFALPAAAVACALLLTSCAPSSAYRGSVPEPDSEHKKSRSDKPLGISPKDVAELSDREYLMRKATLGSRSERLEALDVIQRSNDPEMFDFLMERLKKEDDRFIQIRVMQVLAAEGDVRAVPTLRHIARWDPSRVGIEAVAALYDLGDDTYVPRLIIRLHPDEDFPEIPGIILNTLKKIYFVDLPMSQRAWMNYFRSHRLAPYQTRTWFWAFNAPLPPTEPGTNKVIRHPKGPIPLPKEDVRIRNTNVSWYEFWKPEAP
jgi:hypothetical protein